MPSNNIHLPTPFKEIEDLHGKSLRVKFHADPTYFSQVTRRLRPYKSVPFMFRPALERVADYVREVMIPRTFEQEGPGWAPLAPMTMGIRKSLGFPADHPILYRTGDLFEELTNKNHPRHIEVIKTGRRARIEIGGSSAKFIENQMGGPRLPARPMIPGTGQYPHIPILEEDQRQLSSLAMTEIRRRLGI